MNNWCPTENEVINKAIEKLESIGFNIISQCNTKQQGIDIEAEKNGIKLLIEAKGATSSMEGSKRNGKPFNRNQARTHISVAIYKVMSLISELKNHNSLTLFGICLPFERNHIEFINNVKYSLDKLGVVILWVKENDVLIEVNSEEVKEYF
ncbi:hypothetical protein [Clostridium beijerinckii]|jgi:hypothetical protein|uniref:Uncharacterized protein n=2 Tax=Clostridium beijerinckii TaxID=1520 RepID=A0AAE2RUR1_CLOBE|nr:hypothetical protein [Clostridium beijerinckii]ABR33784.1 conserved hypothetical protein [Clostridium beijerinckii NCIMB 8052]AIU01523.1 hypothetical protein Cbs_1610 [Clostridium beijerinckii ATCC 35702]MBF7812205.1 hypothetical protein [Clostridium beijerinckii]NRT24934.1 hypothetical protein [Clostridium beijerinckii]NRT67472.1 hypothetical protein [Clostridium beijerinckii]